MKFILITALFTLTAPLLAQANAQNCFSISNDIDRKYCIDKYLETIKNKNAAEKKSWGKGLPAATKTAKQNALTADIKAKKDQMSLLNSEIALIDQLSVDLNAVPVAAAPAPAKKEKKKKFPFGIKL